VRGVAYAGFWWGILRERPLGRHRHILEDNIEMNHQVVGCGGMDWMELVQDRDKWRAFLNAVMNLRVP
jgi:hypothetical protein